MIHSARVYLFWSIVTIVTFSGCHKNYRLETNKFCIELKSNGLLSGMSDKMNGKEYLAENEASSLLSIRINGTYYQPDKLQISGNNILLEFDSTGISAKIKTETKLNYLTLELTELSDTQNVDLVLWGPYKTVIKETIGETIGVTRDTSFAIGIQALNPRTLGGFPENEDDSFTGYDIFATTSLVDIADSVHILYRGNTARPESYGSSLNAYTRSRNSNRVVSAMQNEKYTAPAYKDGGLIGSKIALFGCDPGEVMDIIEEIELAEGLPHPLLDGEWAKRSGRAVSAYLIMDFTPDNYRKAIEYTKRAGLKYLYHSDLFKNWGHFDLRYDMTREELSSIIKEAESQGVRIGAHTLSNFITVNDPYVTPVPDKRLAKVGCTVLTEDISKNDTSIAISDPSFFNQMKNNNLHTAMIGKELIRYEKVSGTRPWQLTGCERGAFGTTASSFNKGDTISKLADHAYKVFLTDSDLSAEVAARIAELYNKTGLKQISFDGLEGNSSTGMGKYGELLFVKNWFDNLTPEIKNDYIMDASTPGHYFWHMFTRMNWGEPWYAGFRESQTEYRLLNQDYFRRNYIPCMLGWFSMRPNTSVEDIEWMLARSAAFDAGYALVASETVFEKNGCSDVILEKIKQWEKARMRGSFSSDQKKIMENIKNEFSLNATGVDEWQLVRFEVKRFEHMNRVLQPGQPESTSFSFNNPFVEQALGFIITVTGEPASDIIIEIDNNRNIVLPVEVAPGENLKYTGGEDAVLYSENWQIIKRIPVDKKLIRITAGEHSFSVDCTFPANNKGTLKLEIKTAGDPVAIRAQ